MAVSRILLDVHAHLVPLRPGACAGEQGIEWSAEGRLVLDGAELPNAQVYDPQALVTWMDRHGVGVAWVSVPPTLYRPQLDAHEAAKWCVVLNTALDAAVDPHASRLQAMHHLPMQHPDLAARIVSDARRVRQRRFAMPAGDPVGLRVLSDPAYEPLWAALHRAGAFLFLHPGRACDPRFRALSLTNLLGGPTETAIAGAHLAMAGILERYAGITFCLAHGGGTLPAAAGRLQRGQDTEREGAYLGGEKVRQALRRFCVDCITHDAESLKLAAATFGEDRVVFGSDWPFAMGLPDPELQLQHVPPRLRARVMRGNAAALLDQHGNEGAAT